MYEAMSDVDTGTDPTPTLAELPNGLFFCKSNAQDGTARKWRVIGDERGFWLVIAANANQGYDTYFCGDVVSWKDPDPWCAALWGKESAGTGVGHAMYGARTFKQDTYDTGRFLMRQALGGGKAQRHRVLGHNLSEDVQGASHPFPNAATGGMLVAPGMVLENSGTAIRGWMPGIYQSFHTGVVGHGSTAQVIVNGQVRTLLGISNNASIESRQFVALFDITGPWR